MAIIGTGKGRYRDCVFYSKCAEDYERSIRKTPEKKSPHWICVITRCAATGWVPPASGVIVSAVELPTGF